MPPLPAIAFVRMLARALEPLGDNVRAVRMSAYMRSRFTFLGIPTPALRASTRQIVRRVKAQGEEPVVLAVVHALWGKAAREYQYVAVDLLAACEPLLTPAALPPVATCIVTKSWWDTVDGLAGNVVGPLTARHVTLRQTLDAWSVDENMWLRRAAILHQLRYRSATDARRLFAYCVANAGDPDFFIRKGIGWALRKYAHTNPSAVGSFLDAERARLSPLTLREAGKHLPRLLKEGNR